LLLCFVFPIICHPPLSTLFPYTTLFRSAFCALQRTGVDRPRAAQMLRDEHACGFVARDDARRDLERGGLGGDPRFVDEIERARAIRAREANHPLMLAARGKERASSQASGKRLKS